jgi:hypothetical protein
LKDPKQVNRFKTGFKKLLSDFQSVVRNYASGDPHGKRKRYKKRLKQRRKRKIYKTRSIKMKRRMERAGRTGNPKAYDEYRHHCSAKRRKRRSLGLDQSYARRQAKRTSLQKDWKIRKKWRIKHPGQVQAPASISNVQSVAVQTAGSLGNNFSIGHERALVKRARETLNKHFIKLQSDEKPLIDPMGNTFPSKYTDPEAEDRRRMKGQELWLDALNDMRYEMEYGDDFSD